MRLLFLIISFYFLSSCSSDAILPYTKMSGKTMGTTYNITFQGDNSLEVKKQVDELLVNINEGLSTYIPDSRISLFNQNYPEYLEGVSDQTEAYFLENFDLAAEIFEKTSGAFDPTIMPIVNYWGFGYTEKIKVEKVDTARIVELMKRVGFDLLAREESKVKKDNIDIELDFSAVAKGYGVDKVSDLLSSLGLKNHYVEIGGEVFARGVNPDGNKWRTGITVPNEGSGGSALQEVVEVSELGIATSGNYINYYESNGQIFSHTINPKTGFPERSNLLSATVIAPSCAEADGYATACMVMGLEKSVEFINLQKELEGIFIFVDDDAKFQVYDSRKN